MQGKKSKAEGQPNRPALPTETANSPASSGNEKIEHNRAEAEMTLEEWERIEYEGMDRAFAESDRLRAERKSGKKD